MITALIVAVGLGVVGAAVLLKRDPAEEYVSSAIEFIKKGEHQQAQALLEVVVRKYPDSDRAEEAQALLATYRTPEPSEVISPLQDTTAYSYREPDSVSSEEAEKLYRQARNFYAAGFRSRADLVEASKRFMMIADSYPNDPLAADALYESAQIYHELGQISKVIGNWQRFIERYPLDGRVPEALYAMGHIHLTELGREEQGRTYFLELIERFPRSNSAEAARRLLGIESPLPAGEEARAAAQDPDGVPSIYTTPGAQ